MNNKSFEVIHILQCDVKYGPNCRNVNVLLLFSKVSLDNISF